jgi:hypothetical protein
MTTVVQFFPWSAANFLAGTSVAKMQQIHVKKYT